MTARASPDRQRSGRDADPLEAVLPATETVTEMEMEPESETEPESDTGPESEMDTASETETVTLTEGRRRQ